MFDPLTIPEAGSLLCADVGRGMLGLIDWHGPARMQSAHETVTDWHTLYGHVYIFVCICMYEVSVPVLLRLPAERASSI